MVRAGSDEAVTLQLAIEASPSGILVVDADGTIVLVNGEIERQFGYARHEIVGQAVEVLLPEVLRSIHEARRESFADAPAARPMGAGQELYGRRKDGSPLAVEIALKPLEAADGPLVLASVVDVTEPHRLRDAQRASFEEQLEFERFVAELSFQFINLPNEQVADSIQAVLPRISALFGLDRCSFFRISADNVMVNPVTWTARGIPLVERPVPAQTRFPWTVERLLAGEVVSFSTLSEVPSTVDRESFRAIGTKSGVILPLSVDGRVEGGVAFGALIAERTWAPEVVHRFKVFASVFDQVLARQKRDETLHGALQEVQRLKDQVQAENVYLRREVRERLGLTAVVGQSPAVRRVLEQIQQVARDRLDGAAPRRNRHRQGTVRRADPRARHPACAGDGAGELRRDPGHAHRERIVRAREGRLTRARWRGKWAASSSPTTRRSSSTRLATCRPRCRSSCLRVLEERQIERLGQPAADRDRHADHRRHASKSRATDRRGRVSRGSLLPAERVSDPHSAAPGAHRGHSAPRVAVRRGILEGVRQAHRRDRQGHLDRARSNTAGPGTSASSGTSSSGP